MFLYLFLRRKYIFSTIFLYKIVSSISNSDSTYIKNRQKIYNYQMVPVV